MPLLAALGLKENGAGQERTDKKKRITRPYFLIHPDIT
jgi:hypothetical protein